MRRVGHLDADVDVEIAARAAVEDGDALVAHLELRAVLRAFGDLELVRLAEGGHFDLAAQGGLRDIQRDGAVQVVFVALEEGVLLHLEEHVEIARGAAVGAGLAFAWPGAGGCRRPRRPGCSP